jgi:2-amino-4-hydroxy-6-hydroxymethyldihydropteridine diphosphokinase
MPHAPVTGTTLACIGLGANVGDTRATLDAAQHELAALPCTTLVAASPLYRSAPIDAAGPDYLNAVIVLATALTPLQLLAALQAIERTHGRVRGHHHAPRTLDLDLLLYGHERIATPALTVPHPRLHERAFVLRPLLDVLPDVRIPGLGPAANLLAAVADQSIARLSP